MKQAPIVVTVCLLFLLSTSAEATHGTPAPVAWWKLDETAPGTTVADDSVGTNDGAFSSVTGPTIGLPGHHGTSYGFDGTNDEVVVPNDASLESLRVTISAWVQWDGAIPTTEARRIVERPFDWGLTLTDTGKVTWFVCCYSDEIESSSSIPPTGFHHVVGTYDGSWIRIFIDGALDTERAFSDNDPFTNGAGIYIGSEGGVARFFEGQIDDVRFYGQALRPDQVEDLYLDPAHHPCDETTEANSLTGWVEPLAISITTPLLIILVIASLIVSVANGIRTKWFLLPIVGAGFGVQGVPTAAASHACALAGSSLASTIGFIIIPLVFFLAIVGVIFIGVRGAVKARSNR